MVTFSDIIGTLGVALVVLAYFKVQSGQWKHNHLRLPVTNLTGACMILVSLVRTPNLPSIIIEIIWIAISVYGILRIIKIKQNRP